VLLPIGAAGQDLPRVVLPTAHSDKTQPSHCFGQLQDAAASSIEQESAPTGQKSAREC
jgi:hypothetical protein